MTTAQIFVYGSLTQGMVHYRKIESYILDSTPASIQGSAYRLQVGFPVVVKSGEHRIFGQLVTINLSESLLSILDEWHGYRPLMPDKSLHIREKVQVHLGSGELCLAETYFYQDKHLPKHAELIIDGYWQTAMKTQPALIDQLTEKQIHYVKKLGQASGREIVPINDLALYRELMKLNLIVDKGRRLALSKLGRELFHYLA